MPSFPTMELGEVYFHTASILNWEYLLKMDKYKKVILDSLNHLSKNGKIKVYGFVIMPNHIHLIWEMIEKNGKEMPHVSFMKHTAHEFLKDLKTHYPQVLPRFASNQEDRKYQFWQRNSLPIILYSKKILEQKLDYIHYNPTAGKWNLATDYVAYYYSSAKFYEEEINDFEFLVDYRERF
ncbi:transposase [Bernardetia sp. ABR2-2B]|uniref:transposase n=1 Tax=Bernardetia sp. ABR2-2B TaxID=3127472 RepID=UPI0030D1B3C0